MDMWAAYVTGGGAKVVRLPAGQKQRESRAAGVRAWGRRAAGRGDAVAPPGVASYPVITTGQTVHYAAKDGTKEAAAGTITPNALNPTRVQARFQIQNASWRTATKFQVYVSDGGDARLEPRR